MALKKSKHWCIVQLTVCESDVYVIGISFSMLEHQDFAMKAKGDRYKLSVFIDAQKYIIG